MAKLFFFAIFSIGYLIAQAVCGRLDTQSNQLELSESPSLTDSPFLSCELLINISACSATCSLIGSVYGEPVASGICSDYGECMCNLLPKASLEDYWNKKFDSDSKNVLGEILKDRALHDKVRAVLKRPFQTYQETVSALKPLLNEKQLKNLHPRDKEAQNIFVADDKFKAVEDYVAKNLTWEKSADGNDTKKYLSKVLQSADGAYFNRIYQEVCRSQNNLLIEALNERNRNRNINSNACSVKEDEGNVIRLIDVAAVNKLIKLSPSKPSNQSDSNEDDEPSSQSDSNANEPKKSKSTARSSNARGPWWKLRGINKSEIGKLKEGSKNWEAKGYYYVSLEKTRSGLSLTWHNEKHRVNIVMNNAYRNEITQKWNFPDVFVELHKKSDGTRTQKWVFQNSTYEVTINSKGKIQRGGCEGKEKKDLIKKYKQGINSWCAENGYIIGKDNCIIY
ncbi:uncharacterized protein LOC135838200 [Planococcus citri]|uniref:uncharacterized protein LOC135838200 n=1 Tax=Planococcus citri TaxID=170843 RepID=UPI0031F8025B